MYPNQNFNYYPQQQPMNQYMRQPQMPQQSAILKGRMVSSIEEARASLIDFDGSIFYFPDLANKRIYTKQINIDGTATLNVYELRPIQIQQETQPSQGMDANFVTREEFQQTIDQLKASFEQQKSTSKATVSEPQQASSGLLNF